MPNTSEQTGILVAVDGSAESDAAVRWAARASEIHRVPITLIHVVMPVVVTWPVRSLRTEFDAWQEDNARQAIAQAQKALQSAHGDSAPDVCTEVAHGNIVAELIERSRHARMIVIGSRGLGRVGRAVMGSISTGVLHHAHCPVAVVHADDVQTSDVTLPVLVGIDGSPASEEATALAFDEASRRKVDLIALHAWSDVGVFPILGMDWHKYEQQSHEILGERLAGWQEQYPDVRVHRRIVCDKPAQWLIDASEQAQLVVLGAHGRGGFPGMLLGSVSSAVSQSAKCPVIVMRHVPHEHIEQC